MDKIAVRIKELIDNLGLTNTEFAKQTNLNPATVSHILSGRNKVSLQVIGNIKESFTNVNIDYMITGEGAMFIDVTNVNSSVSSSPTSPSFPMEGVRIASIGAMPVSAPTESTGQEKLFIEETRGETKTKEAPTPSAVDSSEPESENEEEKVIERIVLFYTDGSFKSYRP